MVLHRAGLHGTEWVQVRLSLSESQVEGQATLTLLVQPCVAAGDSCSCCMLDMHELSTDACSQEILHTTSIRHLCKPEITLQRLPCYTCTCKTEDVCI